MCFEGFVSCVVGFLVRAMYKVIELKESEKKCKATSHMMSNGETSRTIEELNRTEVLFKMNAAINRWKLKTRRNINFR